MIWTRNQFKSHTSVWGFRNNPLLFKIETQLDRYHAGRNSAPRTVASLLKSLSGAINDWLESKAEKIARGKSNRSAGVLQLLRQVEAEFQRVNARLKPYAGRKRNVNIPGMCPKRTSYDSVNTDRVAGPVREVKIFQRTTHHLTIREAIWRSALTSGPWSERRKAMVAIEQINSVEGARNNNRDNHPDSVTAIETAGRAITQARKFLPLGGIQQSSCSPPPGIMDPSPGMAECTERSTRIISGSSNRKAQP